ncbi:MAG: POTRA domain-containing protein [bacterium]
MGKIIKFFVFIICFFPTYFYSLNIEFKENKVFTSSYLQNYFSKENTLESINLAVKKILFLYKEKGYLLTNIDIQKNNEIITLLFKEGPCFVIEKIIIEGVSLQEEKKIRLLIESKKDNIFFDYQLEKDIKNIIEWYKKQGFLNTKITLGNFCLNKSTGTISCILLINKGDPPKIGQINIVGNKKTKNSTITKIIKIKSGEIFKIYKFNESIKLLEKSSIVFLKDHKINFDEKNNLVNLDFLIEEKHLGSFDGLIGNNQKNFYGSLNLMISNILGRGEQNSYFFEKNSLSKTFFLNIHTGLFFPIEFSGNYFIYEEQELKQIKKEFGLGFDLLAYSKIKFRYGNEKIIDEDIKIKKDITGITLFYNSLNDLFMANSGVKAEINFDIEKRKLEKETDFRKKIINEEIYFFSVLNSTMMFRLLFSSYLIPKQKKVFLSEYFKLGGAVNLRGFREGQFRGITTSVFTVEYLKEPFFMFWDTGYVYEPLSCIIRSGYGCGIKQKTKIGILSLVFGFGEGKDFMEKLSLAKIHFKIKQIL